MNYTRQKLVLIGLSLVAFSNAMNAMRQAGNTRYDRDTDFYENLAEGSDQITIDFRKTIGALKKDGFGPADASYVLGKVRNNPRFITAEDTSGNSLLSIAAQKGRTEVAQFLIDQGARVNWPNKNGDTPLSLASQPEMIQLLVQQGGIDTKRYDRNQTIAENLAEGQGENTIDFRKTIGALKKDNFAPSDMSYVYGKVVNNPGFIRAEDTSGNSLLAIAAQKGLTDAAQFFIQHGSRVNWPNKQGETPLDLALKNGHEDTAHMLRNQGGVMGNQSPQIRLAEPLSPAIPLQPAPASKKLAEANHFWYDRNDPDDAVADLGHYAVFQNALEGIEKGNIAAVKSYVKDSPGLITAEDSGGNTLLAHAAIQGRVDSAQFLIEQGARVNWPNKQGDTPLAFAVRADNRDMINLLRDNGGLLNAKITIMLVPSSTYTNSMTQFAERYFLKNRDLGNLVTIKAADKLHISLVYALVPMTYVDDARSQERAADFLAKISKMSIKQHNMFLEDPHFLDITWNQILPMGRFIAVSYDAPFHPVTEAIYNVISNEWGMHKLYPTEEPIHVSIAETKDKKQLEPSLNLPQVSPPRELTRLNLSSQGNIIQNVSVSYPIRGKNKSEMKTDSISIRGYSSL